MTVTSAEMEKALAFEHSRKCKFHYLIGTARTVLTHPVMYSADQVSKANEIIHAAAKQDTVALAQMTI